MVRKRYFHFHLGNGVEVVVYPISEVRAVSVQLGMARGASEEREGEVGTLHFLEHMMFQGCRKYSKRQFLVRAEELGVNYNGSVGSLVMRFWFHMPDTRLKKTLEFIAEVLGEPVFLESEVENARRVILAEQRNYWDVPENQFFAEAARRRLGRKHPYTREGFGEKEVVERTGREDLEKCFRGSFWGKSVKLSIAGNVEVKELREVLEKSVGRWKAGEGEQDYSRPDKVKYKKDVWVYDQPRQQVRARLAFPLGGFRELELRDRLILGVVSFLLGGGVTSVLNMRLREELGLVYSVGSGRGFWPYEGELAIGGLVNVEKLEEMMEELWKCVLKVKDEGFLEKDFKRAIKYMNVRTLIGFSEPGEIAASFLFQMIDKERLMLPKDYVEMARGIKLEEVNEMARKVLDFKVASLALMGDKKGIEKSGVKERFGEVVGGPPSHKAMGGR